jgi:nitronate monooxygenase
VSALLERLGVELPVVQAGMGGGIARHELAAAVSEAGGLGTIGTDDAPVLERELQKARALTGKPVAVNLLLPFATAAHWRVARQADAVVTFWGRPLRRSPGVWLHQCGSLQEALTARAAGADGVIVQGVEAGGHVESVVGLLPLLVEVGSAVSVPLIAAGGIADPAAARAALAAGAQAIAMGTRFVVSTECEAHPSYKSALVRAKGDETVLTDLFDIGWPAPHRVLRNSTFDRWEAAGRPPSGSRPGEGDQVARSACHPVPRYAVNLPRVDVEGDIEAMAMYSGQGVGAIAAEEPAGEIVERFAYAALRR